VIVQAAPREHFDWLRARSGCKLGPAARVIEALDSSGRIRGMVGYDCWAPNSVQMHLALDAPIAARSLLRPAFEYPFVEAGRGIVFAMVASNAPRVSCLVESLGFARTHCFRDGYAVGVDIVFYEMRRESCRWLRG
jgi:hypothetical protein